jgi:type II secretory ATPase GspE/PulE/Tfp pilus assembly ATPase PilB-like protein
MMVDNIAELSARLRMPAVNLEQLREQQPAFDLIPYSEAARRACIALRDAEGAVSVVLGDPFDLDAQDWIEERLVAPFRYRLASREDVDAFLAQQEASFRALDGISKNSVHETNSSTQEISFEATTEGDSTVVKLVSSTLYDALKAGASDVHLESTANGLTIKYRVDGVLTAAESMPGTELAEQVISRIKVMSELDIAERRVPQDGRFKARKDGRDIDFRVSVMPSVFGEDAVLRILDRRALTDEMQGLSLDALGFAPEMKAGLRQLSTEPYGMVLVTGPTGSGKTTTLYSALSRVNTVEVNIMTAEDPVEYNLMGINQVLVRNEVGLTFAAALKAFLRQDPNIIMIGEIRDLETGGIAIKAALTGHLVLSTLHTNDAPSTITRMIDMGIEAFNVSSAVNLVVAQRLVRRICSGCKANHTYTEEEIAPLRTASNWSDDIPSLTMKGTGCDKCNGTGYKGRAGIYEVMALSPELRRLILRGGSVAEIRDQAVEDGMLTLRMDGIVKIKKGVTTLEEVIKETAG